MLSQIFHFFRVTLTALFSQFLVRVRGSLLIAGTMLLVSSSGAWMYLANSLTARDMQLVADHEHVEKTHDVVVVGIDDLGYEQFFGGRSPLDKKRLVEFFSAIATAVPPSTQVVVDLDMAPAPGEDVAPLIAFWRQHLPQRWVIADPVLAPKDTNNASAAWREMVCDVGVRLGFPYLPFEFGYASGTHQFKGAFADVAMKGMPDCKAWLAQRSGWKVEDDRLLLPREAFPSSASFVKNGLVLPFQGDLQMLQQTLSQLKPKVVVIGGMWGSSDVFLTPFGERFGVHLHAAAIAGALDDLEIAPYWLQILTGILFVSLISIVLGKANKSFLDCVGLWGDRRLAVRKEAPGEDMLGHVFLRQRMWPMFVTCSILAASLLISNGLALLQIRTGLWLPSSGVFYMVIGNLLFVWNWGLNQIRYYGNLGDAWRIVYVEPIKKELRSIRSGWLHLWSRSEPTKSISRSRAVLEGLLSAISLSAETILPLSVMYLAITRPL